MGSRCGLGVEASSHQTSLCISQFSIIFSGLTFASQGKIDASPPPRPSFRSTVRVGCCGWGSRTRSGRSTWRHVRGKNNSANLMERDIIPRPVNLDESAEAPCCTDILSDASIYSSVPPRGGPRFHAEPMVFQDAYPMSPVTMTRLDQVAHAIRAVHY